jgi:hypothetical protein
MTVILVCSWCSHELTPGEWSHCDRQPIALHGIPPKWVRWEYALCQGGLVKVPVIVREPGGEDCVGPFNTSEAIKAYVGSPSLWPTADKAEAAVRRENEILYAHGCL